jgi:hypothetical protein
LCCRLLHRWSSLSLSYDEELERQRVGEGSRDIDSSEDALRLEFRYKAANAHNQRQVAEAPLLPETVDVRRINAAIVL